MFTKSAKFYDALYHFKDYKNAAEKLHEKIRIENPSAHALLDVACGTGKHLEHLRKYYEVEGFDLNSELLEVAQGRCPETTFHQGDMVNMKLNKCFDVITCLFSSIGYVKTVENLYKSVNQMAHHLNPNGLLYIEPWISPNNYMVGRITANFVDQQDLKIAWMYTSEVEGRISVFNINYLVGMPAGVEYFNERHEMGLFTDDEYKEAFHQAGLDVKYESEGLFGRGMYTGKKGKF